MTKNILSILLIFIIPFSTNSQDYRPKGKFLTDSIKIGEPVHFSLSYTHPRDMELIFPDSNYNFSPFEFIAKKYVSPTKTDSAASKDSVVYTLISFEIDKIQYLTLPVFLFQDNRDDTVRIFSNIDSVFLKELIKILPDTVVLKENTNFQEVALWFNYPRLIIGIGIFLVVAIVIWLIFGKQFRRKYRMYKLKKNYRKFVENFDQMRSDILSGLPALRKPDNWQAGKSEKDIEKLIILWKHYLSKLERQHYITFTTKELLKIFKDEVLNQALMDFDKAIYGDKIPDTIEKPLYILQDFAEDRYDRRVQQILVE
ncbi:MAG: hypothetical protein FVQ77_07640 [Cytophagales bacterium]|nr:hypothetical protein [Cytophagales bacterium]